MLLFVSIACTISYPWLPILVFGRTIYGMCTGMFSTIGSIFIREITPNEHAGFYRFFNEYLLK